MKELVVEDHIVLLDDEDYEWVSGCKVVLRKAKFQKVWYAYIDKVPLHQLIFAISGRCVDEGNVIDHRNRLSLDNRRCNLRQIPNSHNILFNRRKKHGTSKFIGVSKDSIKKDKWRSQYTHQGINKFIGLFDTEEEAAKAHDLYAIVNHKNPLRLNYPDEAYALQELIGKKD